MSGTRAAPTAGLDDALRRDFLSRLVALAIGAAGTGLHPARVLAQSLPNTAAHAVDARMQLVLLGTHGGPGVDPAQAQTASAVLVAGRPYLIDCGYGTLRQMVAAHVPYLALSTLFLTHLHDDHTADLAALLSLQWTNGKTSASDVYGPYGTAALVEGALAFFRANVQIRTIDEGRSVDPATLFHGHDVPAEDAPVSIFRDDRISVQAVQNTHYPPRSIA